MKRLQKLKNIICRKCELEGHCADDVKCNSILEIENIFKRRRND